jgi:hypothetical protein
MRYEIFKMEREDLVHVGDKVEITEGVLPSSWYYTIKPAVAMSANYSFSQRIKSREGIVDAIETTASGFFVKLALDEDPPEA